jgi:hypothetical protein
VCFLSADPLIGREGKRSRFGRLDALQDEVKARVPALAHQVELAVVHVPDHVMQMLHQLQAQVFFRADGGEHFKRLPVEDINGGRGDKGQIMKGSNLSYLYCLVDNILFYNQYLRQNRS